MTGLLLRASELSVRTSEGLLWLAARTTTRDLLVFVDDWGRLEPWMLAPTWVAVVGCEHCALSGPEAHCWGLVGCHGYYNGCGCRDCSERFDLERAEYVTGA